MTLKRAGESLRSRVGIDLHVVEGLHQGSKTHVVELFSRVIALLPEMEFYLFADRKRWRSGSADMFLFPNAHIVHMPHTNPIKRLLVDLPSLVRQYGLNLLHTQYICPLISGVANAVTIHDILFEDYPEYFESILKIRSRILFRRSARQANLLFTVSEYSKNQLVSHYRIPSAKITTIANGADRTRFFPGTSGAENVDRLGVSPGNYILCVGRLEPRKNHLNTVSAYARLPQPRPKLLIVGQRDFRYQAIQQLISALSLQSEVVLCEDVNDNLLAALYRNAILFAYPSFAEGFGMPVIEAMASGVPVITSDTTALSEIAEGAALLVDPASVSSICEAMNLLLSNAQLRQAMGQNGVGQATKFDWDLSAQIVRDRYRRFLALTTKDGGKASNRAPGAQEADY